MKNVILVGNGVTADILNSYLSEDRRYNIIGSVVDDEYANKGGVIGLETVGLSRLRHFLGDNDCSAVMAVGYSDINSHRIRMYSQIKELGCKVETYIHPEAKVFTSFTLGEGSVILPSALIEPHVKVGNNCVIWGNATLAHHSVVEDNCWVSSGAIISGYSRVKRNSFIGVNATIVNQVVIGESNIIGAAALIAKNTKASTVHLCRTAEPLRYSSQQYAKHIGF